MAQLQLACFPTRNAEGAALAEMLVPLAQERGFAVKVWKNATALEYMAACSESHAVILDATPDRKGEHNYDFALPLVQDHVLVVSRRYLPMNFPAAREWITDPQTGLECAGTPMYPLAHSNDSIRRWVELQLDDLLRDMEARGVSLQKLRARMSAGADLVQETRRRSGEVFISYRNTTDPATGKPVAEAVEAVAARIRVGAYHGSTGRTVRYFPPKVLSSELMTGMRRWQLASWIDWFIGPARELWIYDTEDYYNSWWTLAELTSWIYCGSPSSRRVPPKLRIYDPAGDVVRDAPPGFLPAMTARQARRLARWYVHSDTRGMAPESFIPWYLLGQVPGLRSLPYLKDPVYTREFWANPVFDCPRCRVIGKNRNRFDLDAFLHSRSPNFFPVAAGDMPWLLAEGRLTCPRCTTMYRIQQAAPQILWMRTIAGHKTGAYWLALFRMEPREPGETSLVEMPSYEIG